VKGVYYPGNQKTLHLYLTETANPIVEAGLQAQRKFGAMLVRGFSPEELEQLQYLTDKLHENMKQEETTNG
jgi:DNA-binding MarR family transcriptional regulator